MAQNNATGNRGAIGATGATGPTGPTGATGATGAAGSGSVTSVATTSPISGGTITSTGTISLLVNTDFAWTAGQTITAPAGSTALTLAGGTQTTSFPVLSATQTWNAAGTTFTGIKLNVTNSASATASLLMDLQADSTSLFKVRNGGTGGGGVASMTIGSGSTTLAGWIIGNMQSAYAGMWNTGQTPTTSNFVFAADSGSNTILNASSGLAFRIGNSNILQVSSSALLITSGVSLNWNSDAFLTRSAAATLQLGAANAASPVAQTLQAQGSRSGTDTNVGGANLTVSSGLGTSAGTLSSLILASPIAVGGTTTAQTQTEGARIINGAIRTSSYVVASLPSAVTCGAGARSFVTDGSTTVILGLGLTVVGGGANKVPVYSDGTNWIVG